MIVEVETQEKLRRVRLVLVMSDVSMFLKLAWMSVKVVEEKKMMVELWRGRMGESIAARHLM